METRDRCAMHQSLDVADSSKRKCDMDYKSIVVLLNFRRDQLGIQGNLQVGNQDEQITQ